MWESRIIYNPVPRLPKPKLFSRKRVMGLGALFLFSVFFVGAIYLLRIPYWRVVDIQIKGIETLSAEEVKEKVAEFLIGEYVFFIPRNSMFFLGTKGIVTSLKQGFPPIAQVSFKKIFPHTLEVLVEERKTFGLFCNSLRQTPEEVKDAAPPFCVYIDSQGIGYEVAPEASGSLIVKIRSDVPEVNVGSHVVAVSTMERMKFLSVELKRSADIDVVGFELLSKVPSEIRVISAEGFLLIFKLDDDFQNVFRVLKTVLDEEIKEKRSLLDYIDARFGNKVFYKMRP